MAEAGAMVSAGVPAPSAGGGAVASSSDGPPGSRSRSLRREEKTWAARKQKARGEEPGGSRPPGKLLPAPRSRLGLQAARRPLAWQAGGGSCRVGAEQASIQVTRQAAAFPCGSLCSPLLREGRQVLL